MNVSACKYVELKNLFIVLILNNTPLTKIWYIYLRNENQQILDNFIYI